MAPDGPSPWVRQVAGELEIDPGLPPEVIIALAAAEAANGHRHGPAIDALREDARSFVESAPYFIQRAGAGEPIACECCRTLVALVPEALSVRGAWRPGIWERETFRRHTLRRCEWKRANP